MKLKEKLAKEFSDESGDSTDESIFIVGFEKAREMVMELYLNYDDYIESFDWNAIALLGEEEVGG